MSSMQNCHFQDFGWCYCYCHLVPLSNLSWIYDLPHPLPHPDRHLHLHSLKNQFMKNVYKKLIYRLTALESERLSYSSKYYKSTKISEKVQNLHGWVLKPRWMQRNTTNTWLMRQVSVKYVLWNNIGRLFCVWIS